MIILQQLDSDVNAGPKALVIGSQKTPACTMPPDQCVLLCTLQPPRYPKPQLIKLTYAQIANPANRWEALHWCRIGKGLRFQVGNIAAMAAPERRAIIRFLNEALDVNPYLDPSTRASHPTIAKVVESLVRNDGLGSNQVAVEAFMDACCYRSCRGFQVGAAAEWALRIWHGEKTPNGHDTPPPAISTLHQIGEEAREAWLRFACSSERRVIDIWEIPERYHNLRIPAGIELNRLGFMDVETGQRFNQRAIVHWSSGLGMHDKIEVAICRPKCWRYFIIPRRVMKSPRAFFNAVKPVWPALSLSSSQFVCKYLRGFEESNQEYLTESRRPGRGGVSR